MINLHNNYIARVGEAESLECITARDYRTGIPRGGSALQYPAREVGFLDLCIKRTPRIYAPKQPVAHSLQFVG
jgi:hypothetical protein